MEEIAISKFKANCSAVIDKVQRSGKPVRITRGGKPVAEIRPSNGHTRKSWLGSGRGTCEIVGDIVGPIYAFEPRKGADR